ncbi:hypothetical protein ABF187_000901 [Flavobacterium psychrophilum]
MEEHRAKATMVFHRLRSGGSMEKIVPKGDFFHRFSALLCCGKVSQNFKLKNKNNKYKPNIELCPKPQ